MNPLNNNFNNEMINQNKNTFLNSPQFSQLKQMYKTARMAQNPNMIIQQLANSNPEIAQTIQMLQGKNLKQVFYEGCKMNGIDPQTILKELSN